MGLDMYLSARLYMSQYSYPKALDKLSKLKLPGVTIPPQYLNVGYDTFQVEVPLMYWRKANHIHSWFVANVQDSIDECQESVVSIDQIRELDKLCSETFMAHTVEVALEKFPPSTGFSFGSEEVDDWYWEQTRATMEAMSKMIADADAGKLDGWDFVYRASW